MGFANGLLRLGRRIMRFFNKRNLAILLLALLVLCLVPMLLIMQYNHAGGDDLEYSRFTHAAWEESRSFSNVLRAAGQTVATCYSSWQGTFSAIYLMALQPGLYGEQYYGLGTVLLIGAFLLSSYLFLHVVLIKTLRMDRWGMLMVFGMYSLLCTQMLPLARGAFYWWNGSIYYTFFYSISLVWASLILLRCLHGRRGPVLAVLIPLLSAAIGGGNYVTFLLCAVLLFALLVCQLIQRRFDWVIGLSLLLILAAFAVSYAAPGNAIRAQTLDKPDFFYAVVRTFLYVCTFFARYVRLPVALAVLFTAPALAQSAARSGFRFRYPLLVAVASFALLYIGFFPPVYAMHWSGPERLLDIQFYMLVLLLFLNLYYDLGWLCRVLGGMRDDGEQESVLRRMERTLAPYVRYFYLGIGVLLLVSCGTADTLSFTSVQAASELLNGDAARYDAQMNERAAVLADESRRVIEFAPLDVIPKTIGENDLTSDPNHWFNQQTASYWNKESVCIVWPDTPGQ